jgi:hypothetical protein
VNGVSASNSADCANVTIAFGVYLGLDLSLLGSECDSNALQRA